MEGERLLELDPRLLKAAAFVRPGTVFADVGCDHGRLSVYLAQHGAARGYACDLRPQPLEKARQLLAQKGLLGRVEPVLTDGLHGLEGKGIRDVIIAGIGGEVLCRIVEEAPWLRDRDIRLILQPQSRDALLRQQLYRLGFVLRQEEGVRSGHFVYTVMCWGYEGPGRELSPLLAQVGMLPQSAAPESRAFLQRRLAVLEELKAALAAAPGKGEEAAALAALCQEIKETIA